MPKYSVATRRARIQKLIDELTQGSSVQARDIDLVLTEQQRDTMAHAWSQQKEIRTPNKPKAITDDEHQLKLTVLWQGRCDAYTKRGTSTSKVYVDRVAKHAELTAKAVAELTKAHVLLAEILADTSMASWFDRTVSVKQINQMSLNQMPRCVTSRSTANQAVGKLPSATPKLSKTEIKLAALREALVLATAEYEREYQSTEPNEAQSAKLKALLAQMKLK